MASRNQSQLLSKTLDANYTQFKKNKSIKWGSINAALFAIISYDLKFKCPYHTTTLHYLEYCLTLIFGLNTVYHFASYIYHTFASSPVVVTPHQKKLLGFKDNDVSFKYKSTPIAGSPFSNDSSFAQTPLNLSALSSRSWLSNSQSPNHDTTGNQSVSAQSWVYAQGTPGGQHYHQQTTPPPQSFNMSWPCESIADENSLQDYLRNAEDKEKVVASLSGGSDNSNSAKDTGIFWNHLSGRLSNEALSPVTRRPQYQLAPLNSELHHMLGMSEEGSPKSPQSSPQLWHKLQIDPQHLIQWNANLRKWISMTILDRVIKEIQAIDDALLKCGLADVRIGHVGLDRLKKTATSQLVQHIPTLSVLIPFMEISSNQEYVVQRIKELASGGCMSDYKWNGGGNLHGKSWDESLPTDSAIIMHFFATYLDTQLMPVTQNPEALPFTSQHYCKTPEKPPKNPNSLIIHQTSVNPPNFLLVVGEESCEISKGRNNLIHTILLFLYTVATKHHGMLGRMNLGKSGVNVLWVVDR